MASARMTLCSIRTRPRWKFQVPETVAVVPEVVLGVHGPVVENGVLAALNDLVPQNHLIDLKGKPNAGPH